MRLALAIFIFVLAAGSAGRSDDAGARLEAAQATFARPSPDRPVDPLAARQALLGLKLFRDRRLSGSLGFACETCHYHGLAFADAKRLSLGAAGKELERNTPPLWNLAFARRLRWDGQVAGLEEQVRLPIVSRREMGGAWPQIVARLDADPAMAGAFAAAFPDAPTIDDGNIARALAAYVATLVSPLTRFDRWRDGGEGVLDDEERLGFDLFVGKGGCAACHLGWRFTDDELHATGAAGAPQLRTPPLRELLWSGPYLHDGSADTLDDALSAHGAGLARAGRPGAAGLDAAGRAAVLAFLATLSSVDAPRPLIRP